MTIPIEIFIACIAGALLAGAIFGWDFAVHNHRSTRRSLQTKIDVLQADIDDFRIAQSVDPQRAWIDFGRRNVLRQFETAMRAIRSTLEPD